MIDEIEIWKSIPGYPDYEVSNMGQVRSLKGNRISFKKGTPDKDGYLRTNLKVDGKRFQLAIHKLVMLAFVGPRPEGLEICHGPDSDKTNNHLDNLRYDTHLANMQEYERMANRRLSNRKLNKEKAGEILEKKRERAKAIREEYAQGGTTHGELARKYNYSLNHITKILTGKRHIEAGGPIRGIDY